MCRGHAVFIVKTDEIPVLSASLVEDRLLEIREFRILCQPTLAGSFVIYLVNRELDVFTVLYRGRTSRGNSRFTGSDRDEAVTSGDEYESPDNDPPISGSSRHTDW